MVRFALLFPVFSAKAGCFIDVLESARSFIETAQFDASLRFQPFLSLASS